MSIKHILTFSYKKTCLYYVINLGSNSAIVIDFRMRAASIFVAIFSRQTYWTAKIRRHIYVHHRLGCDCANLYITVASNCVGRKCCESISITCDISFCDFHRAFGN